MARAHPAAQHVGIAHIDVVEYGIQIVAFFHPVAHESPDGGGVFHACIVGVVLRLARVVNGGAVSREGLLKARRQSLGVELGNAVGLGRLGGSVIVRADNQVDEDGVGGADDGARVEGIGRAEQDGIVWIILREGVRGAGDVLHVQPEGVNQHGGGCGAAAALPGLGGIEAGNVLLEVGQMLRGVGAGNAAMFFWPKANTRPNFS